jgi:hypothetical protein
MKSPFCRDFGVDVWATGLGHEAVRRVGTDNNKCLFAGTSRGGSDGTRTRDLRRDRPGQASRRLATNASERAHLEGLLTCWSARRRTVDVMTRRACRTTSHSGRRCAPMSSSVRASRSRPRGPRRTTIFIPSARFRTGSGRGRVWRSASRSDVRAGALVWRRRDSETRFRFAGVRLGVGGHRGRVPRHRGRAIAWCAPARRPPALRRRASAPPPFRGRCALRLVLGFGCRPPLDPRVGPGLQPWRCRSCSGGITTPSSPTVCGGQVLYPSGSRGGAE